MKSFQPIAPGYFDLKGASDYLGKGLSVKRLRKALTEPNGLPHFRVGGKILVSKHDLDRWLKGFRREPVSLDNLMEEVMAEFKEGKHQGKPGKVKEKKPGGGRPLPGKGRKVAHER